MSNTVNQVYLASKSPRRKEILDQMKLQFETLDVDVDEEVIDKEAPEEYVVRVAKEKALAGRKVAKNIDLPVIGSDTCIFFNGIIMGKPVDKAQGINFLSQLSAQQHEVITGVSICGEFKTESLVQRNRVTFRKLDIKEIESYWETGEPVDKAGAYAIQGLGAVFIQNIEGSYSGIMGLPIFETAQLLKKFGIDCLK